MRKLRFYTLFLVLAAIACDQSPRIISNEEGVSHVLDADRSAPGGPGYITPKGALLSTRFASFEQLKKVVDIDYYILNQRSDIEYMVYLNHPSNGQSVSSVLKTGVSESDFVKARDGGFFDRVDLVARSPYVAITRNDLKRIFYLSKRKHAIFKIGDVAFYDLAETMFCQISADDMAKLPPEDLTEKGYINTFNHITGQAFMTSIFSEKLADFIADAHELSRLPSLVTGAFTDEQILDLDNGPVDNYVDLINNEWGQELGKKLKAKYKITEDTHWTPELLANYLNDVQSYYSWAFQISFTPYRVTDEVVVRFAKKINRVMKDLASVKIPKS